MMMALKFFFPVGVAAGLVLFMPLAGAATTVNAGAINVVTGPATLNLANPVYAVNFVGPDATVNGVTFQSDTTAIAGFSSVGPQNVVGWQTKPEFGSSADDDSLEQIYQDIRWTNAAADPPLQANMDVTAGQQYRLQILFYGNHALDTRGWDISVDGTLVVDNVSSLGAYSDPLLLPAYSPNLGLVYTYDFVAPDGQVNVAMGQLGGDPSELPDLNAIWGGLALTQIPEPSCLLLGGLASLALWRRRR